MFRAAGSLCYIHVPQVLKFRVTTSRNQFSRPSLESALLATKEWVLSK